MAEELVWVPSGAFKLPGVLHVPQPTPDVQKPVLMLHGFTGNKSEAARLYVDLARHLVSRGYTILRFDFRCHGDAPLPFEEFRITYAIEDAHSAVDYLKSRTKASSLAVIGLSMGGGVAVKLAAERNDIRALVLLSPALDFTELSSRIELRAKEENVYLGALRMKREGALELARFTVMELAGIIRSPTLIVHAVDDEVVPISQAKRFYRSLQSDKKFLEVKGGHVFSDFSVRRKIESEISAWLAEHAL